MYKIYVNLNSNITKDSKMLLFMSKPKLTTITSGPINKQIHKRMYIKLKTNLYCQYLQPKNLASAY